MKSVTLVCAFLLGLWMDMFAIHLTSEYSSINFHGKDISIYIDESDSQSIETILQNNDVLFEPYKGSVPNLGFTSTSVWVKLEVYNTTDNAINAVVELKNPNLDIIQLYEWTNGTINDLGITGDYFAFAKRNREHRFFQFPVSINRQSEVTYFFRIENHGEQLHIPVAIWNAESLRVRDYNEQFFYGIYYGIILFVFLLNLFMFLIIRERANLHYLLYLFGLGLLQLSLAGFAFEYIWPDSPFLANRSLPFLASFSIYYLILFSRNFLEVSKFMPRMDKLLKYMQWLVISALVTSLIQSVTFLQYSILTINISALLLNVLIIWISIYILRQGFKPARYFVLAFVVLIASVFGFVFKNFGILPNNFLTEFGIQIGSALEVVLLSFAVVDKFKRFKDEAIAKVEEINRIKSLANIELEKKVKERTEEIRIQKDELAEKNKNILDSIQYASRIQKALLPPEDSWNQAFSDSYVLYMPKDIVSGDFYWLQSEGQLLHVAAVDCTGHGVPGAFMSIVGVNGLNRAIKIHHKTKPSEILDHLNGAVMESLQQNNITGVKDGMDIALCSFDKGFKKVQFSGAFNPLYIIRKEWGDDHSYELIEDQLLEIKSTKHAIGSEYLNDEIPYQNFEFELQSGDIIVLFSDGFADQFGGPKNKKFKYSTFKKLLIEISPLPMDEQHHRLKESFDNWMGKNEQVDDVCVIGIRVP